MRRRISLPLRLAACALLALPGVAPALRAQTFDATRLRQPTELSMPMLIHAGDDPTYARPDFDDSSWTRFDPTSSLKTVFRGQQPSVVWYRLHVKVSPDETGLALEEWNISSAFEIYVNGQKLITTGSVSPFVPNTQRARLLRRISNQAVASGLLVIAARVHVSGLDWVNTNPGLYATNLILGQETALSDHIWLKVIGENALTWFYELVEFGLGMVAISLFLAQRHQREYLWIFLVALAVALRLPLTLYALFHNLPTAWEYVATPLEIATIIFTTLMYFALLRIRFGRWIQLLLAAASVGLLFSMMGTVLGVGSWLAMVLTVMPLLVIIAGVIPVLLVVHMRRGNREAGILLIPALLSSLDIYIELGSSILAQIPAFSPTAERFQKWYFNYMAGPFTVQFRDVADCLFVLSLAIIIVLRSTRISRQQAFIESELEAARQVQQVILPDQIESVPGFSVESIYEPARQVGGDFFQVLPAPEGGLLVVVGDVTGKGLPAAMLVSVLVGATRGVAEYTSDPGELLSSLNERLIGRSAGGFSTALVAHISAHGLVRIANAGHLWPYLDGREMELPGELPLGVKSGQRYQTTDFHIQPGGRLTFYSDGIVEAQNQGGEMLGFERSRELSTQPVKAIVAAAKLFGQQDDMTVIAVSRDRAVASAA